MLLESFACRSRQTITCNLSFGSCFSNLEIIYKSPDTQKLKRSCTGTKQLVKHSSQALMLIWFLSVEAVCCLHWQCGSGFSLFSGTFKSSTGAGCETFVSFTVSRGKGPTQNYKRFLLTEIILRISR